MKQTELVEEIKEVGGRYKIENVSCVRTNCRTEVFYRENKNDSRFRKEVREIAEKYGEEVYFKKCSY